MLVDPTSTNYLYMLHVIRFSTFHLAAKQASTYVLFHSVNINSQVAYRCVVSWRVQQVKLKSLHLWFLVIYRTVCWLSEGLVRWSLSDGATSRKDAFSRGLEVDEGYPWVRGENLRVIRYIKSRDHVALLESEMKTIICSQVIVEAHVPWEGTQ